MKENKTMHQPVIMIDFGGTYFMSSRPLVKKFAKELGVSEKKVKEALMGLGWAEHATGRSDEKRYWKYFSNTLNTSEKKTEKMRKEYYSYSIPQDGMAQLVRKLKKKYTVAALSSIIVGWVEMLEKKYRISNRFHDHHYSYDHGIDKPDAKFFESAASRMNAKPENCIVVDDNKTFLAAVKKTGAKTILFKNAKQLERDLRKLGVEA